MNFYEITAVIQEACRHLWAHPAASCQTSVFWVFRARAIGRNAIKNEYEQHVTSN